MRLSGGGAWTIPRHLRARWGPPWTGHQAVTGQVIQVKQGGGGLDPFPATSGEGGVHPGQVASLSRDKIIQVKQGGGGLDPFPATSGKGGVHPGQVASLLQDKLIKVKQGGGGLDPFPATSGKGGVHPGQIIKVKQGGGGLDPFPATSGKGGVHPGQVASLSQHKIIKVKQVDSAPVLLQSLFLKTQREFQGRWRLENTLLEITMTIPDYQGLRGLDPFPATLGEGGSTLDRSPVCRRAR
ncbi:uncharacterized protein LOC115384574 [Salarias fasciatus]|uniref:uncharacterized protein LOC115384574 n=1 Tax=Salarias fasciatus TaxID=181472 RepID=UPI0011767023|nr:uncharacterized protein LOC115384574 [Salarias fasciatus]